MFTSLQCILREVYIHVHNDAITLSYNGAIMLSYNGAIMLLYLLTTDNT